MGGGCFDIVFDHVCADGVWVCPPGMILVRDCESFGPLERDGGGPDAGFDDREAPDAEVAD